MRVVVTRPQSQAGRWLDALAVAGCDALALPLIAVGPATDAKSVMDAWERIAHYDAAMFVSANAVDYFFALKPEKISVFTVNSAIKVRAFVTGQGTLAALLGKHCDTRCIDVPPPSAGQFDSEALWRVVGHRVQAGYRVLIVRGAGNDASNPSGTGRDWFADKVLAAGGSVDFVIAYQRRVPEFTEIQMEMVRQAAVDGAIWLFSSSEAIENLVALLPEQSWSRARAVVTHPRIARTAENAGFAVVCESRPVLADLLASIESMQ